MKRKLKEPGRGESGQALLLVVILLLVGTLIVVSLLGFMGTGLIAGQVFEKRMNEVYAADAGIEDAIWQIITKATGLPAEGDDPMEYSIADVNGKVVDPVIITYIDEVTYRINSTATTDAGSKTTIESYINILSFAAFMDNAITSMGTIELMPGSTVYDGDIIYCEDDPSPPPQEQVIDGEVRNECVEGWPTAEQLHLYYWPAVADLEPYAEETWDLNDDTNIGPLYRNGDLKIISTGDSLTGVLEGTVYVKGDLKIGQTNQDFTLDLNYKTIFVEGKIDIGVKCTLTGSGVIVAVGDVYFSPKLNSSPADFIFVMSVEGTTTLNPGAPSSDFYGSLAGNVDVGLQPGKSLYWTGPPPPLEFPGSDPSEGNVIQSILTWESSIQ